VKILNTRNSIILKSVFLLMLILSFFIEEKKDSFNTFMTITSTVAIGIVLSMDIYDYHKTKS